MKYSDELKAEAKLAWISGEPVSSIAKRLGINSRRIVYRWRDAESWENQRAPESAHFATTRRYNALIDKDHKSKEDWFEIDKLSELIAKFEKIQIRANGGSIGPGRTPGVKNGEGKARKKKNDISHLSAEDFAKFEQGRNESTNSPNVYPHQQLLLDAGENPETARTRFVLKGRQEGMTHIFAYEAFKTAVLKGHNQIFISSTKAQAEIFKSYMSIIAREHFGVELSGNPTTLSNGAECHYLSPNSYADSRSGDVYFDECFKTRQWKKMEAIASPMATLKKFRKTYFSSPTASSHEAYEIWSGERYTNYHKGVEIDVTVPKKGDCELTKGRLDVDGIWRCALTIHDCIRMGWDQVDLDELKLEMPDPLLFSVTYECQFIDDTDSVFKLQDILNCGVDITQKWKDFDPLSDQPIGDTPCTGGYDPAAVGDNASCVTMTMPMNGNEKFRLLQKNVWNGVSAPTQCLLIKDYAEKYRYDYFEIDATGPGLFIPAFIQEYINHVVEIQYNPVRVAMMVQKGLSVIQSGRFEYDENDQTLPIAFMTIYMQGTENGVVKYMSRRSKHVGHGDEAWACLHAFMCEPLNPAASGGARGHVYA